MDSSRSDSAAATSRSTMEEEETVKSENPTVVSEAEKFGRMKLKNESKNQEADITTAGNAVVKVYAGPTAASVSGDTIVTIAGADTIVTIASAGTTTRDADATAADSASAATTGTTSLDDVPVNKLTFYGAIEMGLDYISKLRDCAEETEALRAEALKNKVGPADISDLLNEDMQKITLNEPSGSKITEENPYLVGLLTKGKKSSKEVKAEEISQEQFSKAPKDENLLGSTLETDSAREEYLKKQKVSPTRALQTSPNVPRAKKGEGSSKSGCSETLELKRKFSSGDLN